MPGYERNLLQLGCTQSLLLPPGRDARRVWKSDQEDPSSEACISIEGERHTKGATGQLLMQPSARFLLVEYLQDCNCHSLLLNSLN